MQPKGYLSHGTCTSADTPMMPADDLFFDIVTQSDFKREYYPSGHAVNDPSVYPDIFREEEETVFDDEGNDTGKKIRRIYREVVPRYAFAFQQIITVKQLVHLCGNEAQFELNAAEPSEEENRMFLDFREGWLKKDMDIAFYELLRLEREVRVEGAFIQRRRHALSPLRPRDRETPALRAFLLRLRRGGRNRHGMARSVG